jgi:predicted nicotinamide N-methyase
MLTSLEFEKAKLAERYPLVDRSVEAAGRIWRITSVENLDALLERVHTDNELETFPYGLLFWPSAIGLAEHLSEKRHLMQGKRVLEIGAGVGLPGIVAQSLGAIVSQSDYQADALLLSRINAVQNGVQGIETFIADWRDFSPETKYDVVIGSDVMYERSVHDALADVLGRAIAPGGLILLSDPMRPQAMEFMDRMERGGRRYTMESEQVWWEGDRKEIAFFEIRSGE